MLTYADRGGEGVRQTLTLADKGRRGCQANADITEKNVFKNGQ